MGVRYLKWLAWLCEVVQSATSAMCNISIKWKSFVMQWNPLRQTPLEPLLHARKTAIFRCFQCNAFKHLSMSIYVKYLKHALSSRECWSPQFRESRIRGFTVAVIQCSCIIYWTYPLFAGQHPCYSVHCGPQKVYLKEEFCNITIFPNRETGCSVATKLHANSSYKVCGDSQEDSSAQTTTESSQGPSTPFGSYTNYQFMQGPPLKWPPPPAYSSKGRKVTRKNIVLVTLKSTMGKLSSELLPKLLFVLLTLTSVVYLWWSSL